MNNENLKPKKRRCRICGERRTTKCDKPKCGLDIWERNRMYCGCGLLHKEEEGEEDTYGE